PTTQEDAVTRRQDGTAGREVPEPGEAPPLAAPDPAASREEVLARFRDEVYGRAPQDGWDLSWELLAEHVTSARLLRQQWSLAITTPGGSWRCVVMIDLPIASDPVPAFLGLNFRGNHAVTTDLGVLDVQGESPDRCGEIHGGGLREPITLPIARGIEAHRWPAELITSRGFAAITACYLQVGPDSADLHSHGLPALFDTAAARAEDPHAWGGISVWAWLLSRILDALEGGMSPAVDAGRVAVVGHSRLGKTALWAAAQDPRLAAAVSNASGCMGAARSRPVAETPEVLARIRPYWFAPRFAETVLAGTPLPVDQHQLLAAIAPRPLHVGSASEDHNADPVGELSSLLAASPAWGADPVAAAQRIATPPGVRALPSADGSAERPGGVRAERPGDGPTLPPPDTAHHWPDAPLGHHLRRGVHDMMPWDWMQWLDGAEKWL